MCLYYIYSHYSLLSYISSPQKILIFLSHGREKLPRGRKVSGRSEGVRVGSFLPIPWSFGMTKRTVALLKKKVRYLLTVQPGCSVAALNGDVWAVYPPAMFKRMTEGDLAWMAKGWELYGRTFFGVYSYELHVYIAKRVRKEDPAFGSPGVEFIGRGRRCAAIMKALRAWAFEV